VVEKISGQSFDDYVSRELLQPLGMTKDSFLFSDEVKEHIATGYAADGVEDRAYEHMVGRSSGALNCTPTELAKLVQLLMIRGSIAGQRTGESNT
jgi:CubicO group peptidase (beta-lactamase class C family)